MPVIGGFFFPPEEEKKLDPEQLRDFEVKTTLREKLELYELPKGFTLEELEALAHELADARTANEQTRLQLSKKDEEMGGHRRELQAWDEELDRISKELEAAASALQARRDELDQQRNLLASSQEQNLRIIRATFEKMSDPKKAAGILEEMMGADGKGDVDMVAKILAGMSERISARVLQEMETPNAVLVTRRIHAISTEKLVANDG